MKVIIAYASAGSGHFKAAQSIYNYFRQNKNLNLSLIDALEKSNILFSRTYTHGYAFIVKYVPKLWGIGFWITYVKLLRTPIEWMRFIINRLNTENFAKFLIKENPDFIICTHFLPLEIAAYLKRKKKINAQIITVITDFGIHPFWISEGIDTYIVASDLTKEQLVNEGVSKGVSKKNIKTLGIPVNSQFLKPHEKISLYRKFNLDENKFTLLIITGSFGIGPIEEIVDLLHQDVQILVVCAQNKNLFLRLKNKDYPQVKIFGFIDNVEELMAVSDVIITKPGGLTISEFLVMELVPIFISAISGQETENVRILERYGIGWVARDTQDIRMSVLEYKNNPEELNKVRENIRKIKKPNATEELYRVICEDSFRNSG
jgi:processive 1,2-diacylglycerol beta-glucosyltransferase